MVILQTKSAEKREIREKDIAWANAVKERDQWSCVICGSTYAPNAHHIIPREVKEYKYEVDNGISLCVLHHKFSRKISAHNNPLAFFLWLQRFRTPFFLLATERTKRLLEGEGVIIS